MEESDRVAACELAEKHKPDVNPYFWLQHLEFWEECDKELQEEELPEVGSNPFYEDGSKWNQLILEGHDLVMAWVPELEKCRACDRAYAETKGYEIKYTIQYNKDV